VSAHLLIDFPAVHIGHHQIQQDKLRSGLFDSRQAIASVGHAYHVKAFAPQDQLDQINRLGIVLNADYSYEPFVSHATRSDE
jgi:hypothetical protein